MKRTSCISIVLIFCLVFSGLIYTIPVMASDIPKRDYIIVLGTDDLKNSTGLNAFVDYKSTNYNVTVISMADIAKQFSEVTNSLEQLRKYLSANIKLVAPYVLLIGSRSFKLDQVNSHVSFSGTIPMATLLYNQEVPSDLLYRYPDVHFDFADGHYLLSSVPKDNPRFVVGSIPTDNQQFVDRYFDNLIMVEKEYSHTIALSGLIAAGIVGENIPTTAVDCAYTGEKIKSVMSSSSVVTLYENQGVKTSTYPFTMSLTEPNFTSVWNQTHFDWAYLAGHNAVYSNYWLTENGNILSNRFADLTKLQKTVFLGVFDGCSSACVGAVESLAGFFTKGYVSVGLGYTSVVYLPMSSYTIFQKLKVGYSLGDALYYSRKGVSVTGLVTQAIVEEEILGDPSACLIPQNSRVTLSDPSNSTVILPGALITFFWDKTDPAWAYNVQVSNSSDFSNLVKSDMTYTNSYQIPSLPVGNYFWRVQGIYDNGLGDWSETKSFAVHEPLSLIVNSLPAQVSISEVVISGSTTGSRILINNQEQIITNGNFSTVITLSLGKNTVKVTALDDYGQSVTKELVTTYQALKTEMVLKLTIGVPTIWVDGKATALDAPPVITNSRTLVPLRAIFEAAGGDVGWNPSTKQITIVSRGQDLVLTIGKNTAVLNGKVVSIDLNPKVVPTITNSRTLLPLRFVAEAFGFQVDWNAEARSIVLTYGGGS